MGTIRKAALGIKVKRGTKARQPKLLEKQIEMQILLWLSMQKNCKAWKNRSMGVYNAQRGVYLRPMHQFTEKGSADILGIWKGKMLCIEVKSARGKLQPHQEEFLRRMRELGALAFMARSLEDVMANLSTVMVCE